MVAGQFYYLWLHTTRLWELLTYDQSELPLIKLKLRILLREH